MVIDKIFKGILKKIKIIGNSKGGILVEFALFLPLFVTILYYMLDAPRFRRIQSNVNFAAHCMTNIIQNISQNRANKKITKTDLAFAKCTAGLSLYSGSAMYPVSGSGASARRQSGHFPLYLYYVIGTGSNRCKIMWCWDSGFVNTAPSGDLGSIMYANNNFSIISYLSGEVDSANIYKELKINAGEMKILLDFCFWSDDGVFVDGKPFSTVSVGRRFGLYLMTPKSYKTGRSYFNTVVIFSPRPGLFDATAPS